MNKFMTNLTAFFKKFRLELLVLGLVFVVFNFMLLANGAFPYGKNTLLIGDSFALIGITFEHIFDWFSGNTGLFFNAKIGGGAEVLSMMLYMVLNPFFLLVLPFGKANIFRSFNFVIFACIIFNVIITMWFARKHFKNLSNIAFVMLVMLYNFSSFMLMSLCSINWLIFPAIILIVLDRFEEMANGKSAICFALSLFWLVASSFVVGVAANLLLFMIFVLRVHLTKEKEEQKEIFAKLFFAYVVAVLLSVIVEIPAIVAIFRTSRAGSIFDTIFSGEMSAGFMHKLSVVAIDAVLLVFAIIYLVTKRENSKKHKFWVLSTIIVLVPAIFDGSLSLFFGGYYSGFPARIHFVAISILFILAAKLFDEKSPLEKEENEQKSSKLFLGLYVFMVSLLCLAVVFFGVFQLSKLAVAIKDPMNGSSKLYRAIVLLFAVLVLLLLAAMLGKKREVLSAKVLRFTVCFVMIFSCLANVVLFSVSSSTNYSNLQSINVLLSATKDGKVKVLQSQFGEVNVSNKALGSMDYFSSTIAPENTTISKLGYYTTPVNISSESGTLVADSLLGLKYVISKTEQSRPYLEFVAKNENMYLYRNSLASSGAVMFDKSFELDENKSSLEILQSIANEVGEGVLFEDVALSKEEILDIDKIYAKNVYKFSFTAERNGILYLKNMALFEQAAENSKKIISKKLNSNNIFSVSNFSNGQTDLGFVNAGETLTFYLTDADAIDDVKFTFMNYETAENVCTKLKENSAKFEYTKTGYKVSGTAPKNKKLVVFMSDVKGMQYSLSGQDIQNTQALGGFAVIDLSEGSFEISAQYKYPNAKLWPILSICCLVALVAVCLVYKFTKFKHIKTALRGIFMALEVGFVSIFVVFGIVLTIFKILL